MIYFTGDTHGDFRRFNTQYFPEGKDCTKEDFVIILGDFGGVWKLAEDREERSWLNWLEEKPWTTLFVDGNHENHDRLSNMTVEEWRGGKIHRVRPSVLHLMRGQVFHIGGYRMFTFGGACSHDISAGILDPFAPEETVPGTVTELVLDELHKISVPLIRFPRTPAGQRALNRRFLAMQRRGELCRVRGVSWWDDELPSDEEMREGWDNLQKNDNRVDFILSHSPDTPALHRLGYPQADRLSDYLWQVKQTVEFKQHLFGHMHVNEALPDCRAVCLYEQISGLPEYRGVRQT